MYDEVKCTGKEDRKFIARGTDTDVEERTRLWSGQVVQCLGLEVFTIKKRFITA
jgi:hypothetical protein